jgi:hypothetical protein
MSSGPCCALCLAHKHDLPAQHRDFYSEPEGGRLRRDTPQRAHSREEDEVDQEIQKDDRYEDRSGEVSQNLLNSISHPWFGVGMAFSTTSGLPFSWSLGQACHPAPTSSASKLSSRMAERLSTTFVSDVFWFDRAITGGTRPTADCSANTITDWPPGRPLVTDGSRR